MLPLESKFTPNPSRHLDRIIQSGFSEDSMDDSMADGYDVLNYAS